MPGARVGFWHATGTQYCKWPVVWTLQRKKLASLEPQPLHSLPPFPGGFRGPDAVLPGHRCPKRLRRGGETHVCLAAELTEPYRHKASGICGALQLLTPPNLPPTRVGGEWQSLGRSKRHHLNWQWTTQAPNHPKAKPPSLHRRTCTRSCSTALQALQDPRI